jgi:hypothetical protein
MWFAGYNPNIGSNLAVTGSSFTTSTSTFAQLNTGTSWKHVKVEYADYNQRQYPNLYAIDTNNNLWGFGYNDYNKMNLGLDNSGASFETSFIQLTNGIAWKKIQGNFSSLFGIGIPVTHGYINN